MIPPCDPLILNNNPQFKSLHNHLTTTSILDPADHGHAAAVEKKGVRDDLRACRIRYLKTVVLKRVVGRVAGGGGGGGGSSSSLGGGKGGLPDELQDLVTVIALYLHHDDGDASSRKENEEFLSLFRPDLEAFRENIRVIASVVAGVLASDVERLRGLVCAGAGAGASTRAQTEARVSHRRQPSRAVVSVSKMLGVRLEEMRRTRGEDLPDARKKMTATAGAVLAAQAEVMERMVQVLERTKYGALAREGKTRAEYLAKVAEGVEGKVRILKHETLSTIYTPDTVSALTHYREHLRDTRIRLEERETEAITELQAYELADSGKDEDDGGSGGSRTARERKRNLGSGPGVMVEIARRYGALVKEVEGVRMEIERLGGEG